MAKVLLLGGTGAIGRYVQHECLALGYQVSVTTRSDRIDTRPGITYIKGNALDDTFLFELLRSGSYDAIVDFMVYRTADFLNRVTEFLNNSSHYIYLSSYRVFADTGNEPITETSPRLLDVADDSNFLQTDEYALAKARQENILRSQDRKNWTIVRPSITYAENRLQFGCLEANTFLPRVHKGLPVAIPKEMMDRHTTMTWAADTAKMIVSLLFNDAAIGADFNVLTNETRTWREIADLYYDLIGLRVCEVDLAEYMSLGLNRYQVLYDRLFNRICDNTKIRNTIKIDQSDMMLLEDGLRESCLGSLISNSALSRLHGRMDVLCGVNRITEAHSLKDSFGYFVGRTAILNRLAVRMNARKFAPQCKPL